MILSSSWHVSGGGAPSCCGGCARQSVAGAGRGGVGRTACPGLTAAVACACLPACLGCAAAWGVVKTPEDLLNIKAMDVYRQARGSALQYAAAQGPCSWHAAGNSHAAGWRWAGGPPPLPAQHNLHLGPGTQHFGPWPVPPLYYSYNKLPVNKASPCRDFFKEKAFMAMSPLPEAGLQALLDWTAKIQRYGGYMEMDFMGPKVGGRLGWAGWAGA